MSTAQKPRQQRRLTHAVVDLGGKEMKAIFGLHGVEVREKHSRAPVVITYERLIKLILAKQLNLTDPAAIELDVAAENLRIVAELIEQRKEERLTLLEVKDQLTETLKLIKAKILLAR